VNGENLNQGPQNIQQSENNNEPVVWILVDDRPGNTTQSIGLAQALGWPYETKQLQFTALAKLRNRWLRTYGANLVGLDKARSAELSPPWPDLLISAGLRTAPIARWIKKQSSGKTVTIQLGRKGGHVADFFDAVVTCGYAQFPPHPRRIETTIPLTRITARSLVEASLEWEDLFRGAARPRVALIVGGSTSRHRFDARAARKLGEDLARLTAAAGGSIFAITSRRTGVEAEEALKAGLGREAHFRKWDPSNKANPYLAHLGAADVIVVTGESESMLAEAAMSGKPVYIYEIPELPLSRTARLGDRIAKRARGLRMAHGQTGGIESRFDQLCTLLVAKGIVRPPRDLRELHETLIRAGIAHRFGEPLSLESPQPLCDMDVVVSRVQAILQNR
jgi:mitochondrial fission protein ELM1